MRGPVLEIQRTLQQTGTRINTPELILAQRELGKIGDNIRIFWDVEDISDKVGKRMSPEDKVALKIVEKSVK